MTHKYFPIITSVSLLLMIALPSFSMDINDPETNPLLIKSNLPFGAPDFSKIKPEHYLPAFQSAIDQQRQNINRIVANKRKATFKNTILALEESGTTLEWVANIFFGLTSAHKTPEIAEIEKKVIPLVTEWENEMSFNKPLFQRIKYVYDHEYKKLKGEDKKLANSLNDFFKKKKFTVVVDNIKNYGYTLDKRDTKIMESYFDQLKKVLKNKDVDYKKYSELIAKLYIVDLYSIDNKVNKYDVPCLEYIYPEQVDKFKSMIKGEFYSKIEDNSDKNRKQTLPLVKDVSVISIDDATYDINGESKKAYIVTLEWTYEQDLGYDKKAAITTVIDNNKVYVVKHSPIMD